MFCRNLAPSIYRVFLAALLAFVGVLSIVSQVEARTLSYAYFAAPNDTRIQKVMRGWAEEVERRTSGSLKVEVAYMSSLLKLKDAVEGVSAGIADAAHVVPAYSQALLPLHYIAATDIGSGDEYVSAEAWSRLYSRIPELQEELDRNNLVHIASVSTGGGVLISRGRSFRVPEDVRGTKLRLASRWAHASRIGSWGVANVSLTISDVYTALQRGTVDGAISYMTAILPFRHNEVIDYLTDMKLGQQLNFVVMNKRVFDSLTQEEREALVAAGVEWQWRHAEALKEDIIGDRSKIMDDPRYPVKIIELTKDERALWRPALLEADEELVKKVEKRLPVARTVFRAYKDEMDVVEREVGDRGYPWQR